MQYCVYVMTNKRNGTLYIGRTENAGRRIWEHKEGLAEGFTKKYGLNQLVHAEFYDDPLAAAEREKRLKDWRRAWKIELIEKTNPQWRDLYEDLNF